jgi:uncharacterized protein (TIGR02118 family)
MYKLVVMYPQPDDPNAFLEYYTQKHVPLANQLPGLVSSGYGQPKGLTPDAQWFLIWEGVFNDRKELLSALKSDVGSEVARDVKNYSPKGATMFYVELGAAV